MSHTKIVRDWLRKQDKRILISSPDVVRGTGMLQKNVCQVLQNLACQDELERAGTKSNHTGKPYILYRIRHIHDDMQPRPPVDRTPEYLRMADKQEARMMRIMDGIDSALNWMTRNRQGACNGA